MNFINIYIAFIVLSLLLLLPGMKIAKKHEFWEDPFSLKTTKSMKGYFGVCVFIHHIVNVLRNLPTYNNELLILEHIGVLLVGFLFLFSGYGLIVSYEEKENYLKTFLFRRICSVLLPYFLCNYVYMTTTLLMGNRFTMKQLIMAFFGVILLNDHMWFAVEIMLLYLAFYMIFRYIRRERTKYISMTLVVLTTIVTSFLFGHDTSSEIQMNWFHGEWWYNTTFLFILGMLFAKFRKRVIPFAQKHYKALICSSAIVFLVFWQATEYMLLNHGYWTETPQSKGYLDKLMTLSVQLPMVISFEIFLLLLLMKVHPHNKVIQFLGKISLEMILLENVFLLCFSKYLLQDWLLYIGLTLLGTLLFATLVNKLKLLILEKKE